MPDFRMTPNAFPVASVIDAAQRNNVLQLQARTQGQQSIIEGLKSIGQIGESLFDQKVKVAQALAGAHMYANTPEGKKMLGTNEVAQTAEGPVTQNETASYDPATGSVTPLKSPVDVRTIATAMYGMAPKDMMENQIQNRLASTQQGELALKQQTEPQKIAIEGKRMLAEQENLAIARKIQEMLGANTIKNDAAMRKQAADNAEFEANKEAAKHWFTNFSGARKSAKAISDAGQGSAPISFATEADAAKAKLPHGTPVIVGGVRGKWSDK